MRNHRRRTVVVICLVGLAVLSAARPDPARARADANQVLDWNQALIDTLIATNTPNSSSQRLGAIVHTAIFDALNGIERRYEPVFVDGTAPRGASRRAAVVAAAHRALVALFPARRSMLDALYAASIAGLSEDGEDGGESLTRGVSWGEDVATQVLAWRAADGFTLSYPAFGGGGAIGQWRPIPPATSMSAQGLAFTSTFAVVSNTQFQPPAPRPLASVTYVEDFNTVKELGRSVGSARTDDQSFLAPFWEGNASVHWNQAANQIARARGLSLSKSSRLLAVLNVAMADTAFTIWKAKRDYGSSPTEVTWRPVSAIAFADLDGHADTVAEASWTPLVTTPSHPEYPAGHPAQNGAAATVLLSHFPDEQSFVLTTGSASRHYSSITQARLDGNTARVWGGMHYPSTVRVSDATGAAIANYVERNAMRRVHPRPR